MKIATSRETRINKLIHDDCWVKAELINVRFNNGGRIKDFLRITAKNGGFVSITARLNDGRFILTRQCKPVAGMTIESAAGGLEKGERWEEAARRELREETRHVPGRLLLIGDSFYPMSDRVDNRCHLFLAFDCEPFKMRRGCITGEEVQGVEYFFATPAKAIALIKSGMIKDLATVTGIFAHFAMEAGRL